MSPRCAILTVVFKGGAPRVTKLKAQMESNSQEAKRMLLERGGGSPPRNKSSVGRLRRSDFVQVWGSGRTGVPALAAPGLFLVFPVRRDVPRNSARGPFARVVFGFIRRWEFVGRGGFRIVAFRRPRL